MASSKTNRYRLMSIPNTYSRIICSAYGCDMRCGTNKLSKIKMFMFPRDPIRRRRWELAIRRANWKSNNKSRLCSKHFITGQPSKDPKHPDYVPSIFVFNKNAQSSKKFCRNGKARKRVSSKKTGSYANSSSLNLREVHRLPTHHVSSSVGAASHLTSSCCGIKGFCGKCFSSESVSSAFSQSLAPLNQTLSHLMGKLKDMEEEREQLRNELAVCRGEIYELREEHQHCTSQSSSMCLKRNSSGAFPSTSSADENEIFESACSDDPPDEYDSDVDVVPSLYIKQENKSRQGKRLIKISKEASCAEVISLLKQSEPLRKKRMKRSIPESEDTSVSLKDDKPPKDEKSSDTSSPITIVYLKR